MSQHSQPIIRNNLNFFTFSHSSHILFREVPQTVRGHDTGVRIIGKIIVTGKGEVFGRNLSHCRLVHHILCRDCLEIEAGAAPWDLNSKNTYNCRTALLNVYGFYPLSQFPFLASPHFRKPEIFFFRLWKNGNELIHDWRILWGVVQMVLHTSWVTQNFSWIKNHLLWKHIPKQQI